MRKGVKVSEIFLQNTSIFARGGLKRKKRVKDFQNFSCRTHQIFAKKPKKKNSGQIFPKFSYRTHHKLLGVITPQEDFFGQNT